jgi:hypothetical protein
MAVIVGRQKRRRMFSHGGLKVGQLGDFLIDLGAMVVIVGQGVMHFRWVERRKVPQDVLDRQAAPIVLHDRTDRKAASFNDRSPPLDTRAALDVRMKNFGRR